MVEKFDKEEEDNALQFEKRSLHMNQQELSKISWGKRPITDFVEAGQFIRGAQKAQELAVDPFPRDYLGKLSPAAINDVQTLLADNGVAMAPDGELIQAYFLPENDWAIFFVTEDLETGTVVGEVRVLPDESAVKGWKETYGWLR